MKWMTGVMLNWLGTRRYFSAPADTEAGHRQTDAIRVLPANLNLLLESCFHTKLLENGESSSRLTFELQTPSRALGVGTRGTGVHTVLCALKGVCRTPSHSICIVLPLKWSMLYFVLIICILMAFMFTGSNKIFCLFHYYSFSALIRFSENLLYPLYL